MFLRPGSEAAGGAARYASPAEAALLAGTAAGAGDCGVLLQGAGPFSAPSGLPGRASAVLGIVGAGGIGFELMAALRLIAYDQVSAILLSILACVVVVDWLGSRLRKALK